MASGRDIKTKIRSTQNMRKVTRALEMVSASKIRKAQDLMQASRPYARMMRRVIAHVAQASTDVRHPFLVERQQVRRIGYIVVATDRGLCGGLNANMFRQVVADILQWRQQGVQADVLAIGQKAVQFFRRLKDIRLTASVTHLGERPRLEKLIGVTKVMLDAYTDGQLDRVKLAYNDFINTMVQRPRIDALLPLPVASAEIIAKAREEGADDTVAALDIQRQHAWDYIYEPDAQAVIEHIMGRYIESLIYHASVENLACEHAARMVAMKSASDNANKVIDTLTLVYNKARQAAITQEISEIVGGAAAV